MVCSAFTTCSPRCPVRPRRRSIPGTAATSTPPCGRTCRTPSPRTALPLFRDHELPLWNRYVMCGLTLLGQGQSMIGDPLYWVTVCWRMARRMGVGRAAFSLSEAALSRFGVGLVCLENRAPSRHRRAARLFFFVHRLLRLPLRSSRIFQPLLRAVDCSLLAAHRQPLRPCAEQKPVGARSR